MCRILLTFILFFGLSFSEFENVHKKHEYLFTFKGPVITVPNTSDVPFFELGGHVIAGGDRVRLTTSLPNQHGWIWSKNSSIFEGFQIDLDFKITGNGRRGADGLALWVVKSKSYGGPAIGSSNTWQGLGVLFDTFDSQGHSRFPTIFGIVNDGTKIYNSQNDGKDISAGHCVRDFRNMPFPTQCRITYYQNVLVLTMSPGLSKDDDQMEECFRVNVDIPKAEYFFGLTSSTGKIADDHDVLKFEVFSLSEIKEEDEKKRIEKQKEYEKEYQQKMDNIAKSETTEEIPKKDPNVELDEGGINRNLMAIWHELSGQHHSMKNLIDLITSKKEGGSTGERVSFVTHLDTIKKETIEVKNSMDLLNRKMDTAGSGYQNQQSFTQLHNTLDTLKTDISNLFEKISKVKDTLNHIKDDARKEAVNGNCGSCISLPMILIVGLMQSACVIGFLIYQKSKDNAAKKFY